MEPLIFIAVMAGLLWLLVIRPQRRRTGEHGAMISSHSGRADITCIGKPARGAVSIASLMVSTTVRSGNGLRR